VLLVLGVLVVALAFSGRPDRCEIGRDLAGARLLAEASDSLDRGDCGDPDVAQVNAALKEATERTEVGRAHAAASDSARAEAAAGNDEETKRVAARRARRADRLAVAALISGLRSDPYRDAKASAALDAAVARLGANIVAAAADPLFPTTVEAESRRACDVASALAGAGLLDAASRAVGQAALRGSNRCDQALLTISEERTLAVNAVQDARALEVDGDDSGARSRYASALVHDSSQGEARAALEASADPPPSNLYRVGDWLAGIPDWLADAWEWLLVVVVGTVLVAALAFRGVRYLAWRSAGVQSWLAPRHGSSALGRRIARLRVSVADFEGGEDGKFSGKDASALIGEGLQIAGASPGAFPFDRMPATSAETDPLKSLTDVLGDVPHGKLASAIIGLFTPLFASRTAQVQGHLLPPDGGGAGISVAVIGPDGRMESQLIRARLIDPAPGTGSVEVWSRLMPAARVWARHQLEAMAVWSSSPAPEGSWRSEALFESASSWLASGDLPRAESCYVRAIEADATLLPALNNLGVIALRTGRYALAIQRLDDLRRRLEADEEAAEAWPALLEACQYNLALAHVYNAGAP
jgi:hypothetical protein